MRDSLARRIQHALVIHPLEGMQGDPGARLGIGEGLVMLELDAQHPADVVQAGGLDLEMAHSMGYRALSPFFIIRVERTLRPVQGAAAVSSLV